MRPATIWSTVRVQTIENDSHTKPDKGERMNAQILIRFVVVVASACGFFIGARAHGDDPKLSKADVVKRAKGSVAFVVAKVSERSRPNRPSQTSQGTAFCVHPSGLFITNAHVVDKATDVQIVLNPSQPNQHVFQATIARTNEKNDLALLRIESKEELPSLPLGRDDSLEELTDVVACGYPFGAALAFGTKEFPSITATAGAISSLRKRGKELELIQLDVTLNPGNSGGPILDLSGKVIGVAVGGIQGAQTNFAIPVHRVAAFLSEPEFFFVAPSIGNADRGKSVPVLARMISVIRDKPVTAEVELRVSSGKGNETTYRMKNDNGVYRTDVVLLPAPAGAELYHVAVAYADGAVAGMAGDSSVMIGETKYPLGKIRSLRPMDGYAITTSGQRVNGKLGGSDAVKLLIGGKHHQFDWSNAQEVTVGQTGNDPVLVLTVIANQNGREVGRITKTVIVNEANRVYLAEIEPFEKVAGPWPLGIGKTGSTDVPAEQSRITINGRPYPKGLGMHPGIGGKPAMARYRLDRTATVFETKVAFNDDNDGSQSGPTHFTVVGDGKELWKSKAITSRNQFDECVLDVTGIDVLEIMTKVSGTYYGAHAVWLDPYVAGPDGPAIKKASQRR